jgi:hypothetical protein
MVYKNTISRENENKLSVQIFTEVADDIAACSDDLLVVAEAIAQSCLMIGTTGDDYREVLTSRAKDFKMLAGLYKARSRRFEDIVERLVEEVQEDKVLPESYIIEKN